MKVPEITLTPRQKEIVTGHLLGDGTISLNTCGNGYLTIRRAAADIEYAVWSSRELSNLVIPSSEPDKLKIISTFDKRTQKTYYSVAVRTKCLPVFTSLYRYWYPLGIKKVPEVTLTPLSMAVWFADDGSISLGKGKIRTPTEGKTYTHRLIVKLATNGFTKEETTYLANQLKTFDLKPRMYQEKNTEQYTLQLCSSIEAKKFLRLIDSDFPDGMERKADRWRNHTADLFEKLKIRPRCPYCSLPTKVYKNGHSLSGKSKYQCLTCLRQFQKQEDYERLSRRPHEKF